MRPIHLRWAMLALAIVLAGLGWFVGAGEGELQAGPSAEESRANERDALAAAAEAEAEAASVHGRVPVESALLALREAARAATPPPPKPEIVGRVVGLDDAPVAGATVYATSNRGWNQLPLDVEPEAIPKSWMKVERTTTDAEGRFAFEGFKPGPLRLAVRAAGFAPKYEDRLSIPLDKPRYELPDLRLERGVFLRGRVVDRAGKGVEGAALLLPLDGTTTRQGVTLPGRGIELARSAADGAFLVDQLAVGPWKLLVDAPGHVIAQEEGRTERAGEAVAGLVFRLEPGLDITGQVRIAETGLPPLPSGLRVTARPGEEKGAPGQTDEQDVTARPSGDLRARHASCDAEGRFVVRGLKPGARYRLALSQPIPEAPGWKRLAGIEPATAWAGERGVEILYRHESALLLRVVDDASGAPITTFVVAAGIGRERALRNEKNEVVREHPEGRVRFGELRVQPGGKPVVLRVSAAGYKDHEAKNVQLAVGQELDLGDVRLKREHLARVTVVDDKTGAPIEGARVMLGTQTADGFADYFETRYDQDHWGDAKARFGRTGPDGKVELTGHPGKTVTLRADAKGYLACEPLQKLLAAEADTEVELRLGHGGTVLARVRDPAGRPIVGVSVAHRKPDVPAEEYYGEGDVKTDAEGIARFDALARGVHFFRSNDQANEGWIDPDSEAGKAPWTEANIVGESVVELAFDAPPRGTIDGAIRESGRPLEGARLKLVEIRPDGALRPHWGGPNDPFSTTTDHEGRYRFENLRCGEYKLFVNHAARRMAARFDVAVEPVERTFDFDLAVTSIEGRITDVDERPLAGVQVMASVVDDPVGDQQPHQMVMSEDERGNLRVNYQQYARRSEKTDEQGRYVLRGVLSGSPIVVQVIGDVVESKASTPMTLAEDEVRRNVDFALRLAGRIEVRFEGETPGKQHEWFEVRALLLVDGKEQLAQSVWLGTWNRDETMRALSPGRYKVVLRANDGAPGQPERSQEVDVVSGETARVVFEAR